MKKLTIGIPTFDRINQLTKIVEFFLNENILGYDNVEFIISDNASSDGTKDYLLNIHKRYPSIIINLEKENRGGEANFARIIEMATAEYVWLVGDDDIILPGILTDILNMLYSYNDIGWGFIKYDCLLKNDILKKYNLQCSEYYKNGIDLFNYIVHSEYKFSAPMFLTASIHKTALAQEAVKIFMNSQEYQNNNALTLGLAFYSAMHGSACFINGDKLIDNITNVSWNSVAVKIFCRDQIAILDLMAKSMKIRLMDYVNVADGLIYQRPEWTYLKKYKFKGNYAMMFFLRNKPFKILNDLFQILKERVERKK